MGVRPGADEKPSAADVPESAQGHALRLGVSAKWTLGSRPDANDDSLPFREVSGVAPVASPSLPPYRSRPISAISTPLSSPRTVLPLPRARWNPEGSPSSHRSTTEAHCTHPSRPAQGREAEALGTVQAGVGCVVDDERAHVVRQERQREREMEREMHALLERERDVALALVAELQAENGNGVDRNFLDVPEQSSVTVVPDTPVKERVDEDADIKSLSEALDETVNALHASVGMYPVNE